MKRILFFLLAFVVYGNTLWAQTEVTAFAIDDVMITPGADEETPVTVKLLDDGPENIVGFQFDLYLPDKIEFVKTKTGAPRITVPTDQTDGGWHVDSQSHEVNGSKYIRFVAESGVLYQLEKGDVFTFYIKASDTFAGAEALVSGPENKTDDIIISTKDFETGTQSKVYQAPFTFKIVTPLDENKSYDAFTEYTGKVKVLRTISAGNWNTICLPFYMTPGQITASFGDGTVVAEFNGCDKHEKDGKITGFSLHFKSSTNGISAHTPYLIKVPAAVTDFTLDEATITDDSPSGSTFVGTYQNLTNLGSEEHPYLFLAGNTFYFAIGKTNMKSFRAYFDLGTDLATYRNTNKSDAGANVTVFVDDEATAIAGVTTDQTNVDAVYDLQGRMVKVENNDLNNLQKGVYIINGQKVTVK